MAQTDTAVQCVRCGEDTENRWPHGDGGLCNGLPLEHGTADYAEAYAACKARRDVLDAAIVAEHSAHVYKLAERVYNGFPFALVELRPAPGDTIEHAGDAWTVQHDDGHEVRALCGDDPDADPWMGIRPSCTHDGLYRMLGGAERDGYALDLLTPAEPPGRRRWSLGHLDRLRPAVHLVEVVAVHRTRGTGNPWSRSTDGD